MGVEVAGNQIWCDFEFFDVIQSAVADDEKVIIAQKGADFPVIFDWGSPHNYAAHYTGAPVSAFASGAAAFGSDFFSLSADFAFFPNKDFFSFFESELLASRLILKSKRVFDSVAGAFFDSSLFSAGVFSFFGHFFAFLRPSVKGSIWEHFRRKWFEEMVRVGYSEWKAFNWCFNEFYPDDDVVEKRLGRIIKRGV